ncbi:MAG: DEAD/DEAH box helicase [Chloroflexales bacterium]
MPLTARDLARLADDVLTFIEQREAEQIAYGVYDVTMTGAEVLDKYQPVDVTRPPLADREGDLRTALRWLAQEVLIIRFSTEDDPATWVFRSRIAETVRLLSKLRQRLAFDNTAKQRQRISHGKRLTGDVTFHVVPRRVPRRRRSPADYLAMLDGNREREYCAALLREMIATRLPKLREISQFQEDSLREILQAIELSPAHGIERGVVVTASTGAGKTYAFFLPMLAKIILERCLRGRVGVKAICIYPRVALSENQLSDFVESAFHVNQVLTAHNLPPITIGIESGAAVYRRSDFQRTDTKSREQLAGRGWRYDERFGGYLAPFAYCVGTPEHICEQTPQPLGVRPSDTRTLVCPACDTPYPFIKFARDVMAEAPPDLLIATTESLNLRLLSAEHQYLFGTKHFCAPAVVMLDEIHLQTSTAGTQVALLLRRLLARIRMGKQDRGDLANLAFVGLSATITNPRMFLAELSGIPAQNIREVQPHEDELEVIGAERYIFVRAEDSEDTAVISTLIQTAMCVLHTMPQPPTDSTIKRYRTFGFVQSLDVVGRWLYQMQDAEKAQRYFVTERRDRRARGELAAQWPIRIIPLYWYRFPPFNRQLFPNLFGPEYAHTCGCDRGLPDRNCRYFMAGECWWALSQKDKARREPLNIRRKSGADRDKPIEPEDDLIITTSALEVGYDDEALMCVIQYTAPSNVASFVQRKGRGGRKVGTRPIVVTVLSPYKSTDLFLFRNQHLLTDPTFRKLPLNAQNRYLQRIHGFYALFDWLAYRAHAAGRTLSLDYLRVTDLAYLMEQTSDAEVLLAFKDYLRRAFAMDAEALSRVLTEESQGLLLAILADGLVQQAHPLLAAADAKPIKTRDLLRKHLPENLFSDINLPEVQVDYRPQDRREHKRISTESISLALSETIPGNVTFRGGQGAAWVPPIAIPDSQLVALDGYYTCEELHNRVRTASLPGRALRLLGIKPFKIRELTVLRPQTIMPAQFSEDHEKIYWYADPSSGALREHRGETSEVQDVKRLAHSSAAFSLSGVAFRAVRERPPRDYSLGGTHPAINPDPISQVLIEKIVLHSDEPANMNLLQVQRVILGSQYTLKSREPGFEEIGGVLGFCRDHTNQAHVVLGFEMLTEGLVIDLRPSVLEGFTLSAALSRRLRASAITHCFITELTVEQSVSYFAAVNLAHVLLTVTDRWLRGDSERVGELRGWLTAGNTDFVGCVSADAREIHGLSPKNTEAVKQLLKDEYLQRFLDSGIGVMRATVAPADTKALLRVFVYR